MPRALLVAQLSTLAVSLFVGCATGAPPESLIAARAAFASASSGAATQLVPVELDNARLALRDAERSFESVGDTPATGDLAYISERRSRRTTAYANVASANLQTSSMQRENTRRLRVTQEQTSNELGATRSQLAVSNQQVAAGQQALSAEHRARTDAERTTAAALESLRQVASVREESRGMVITLSGSVLFASGESALLPIALQRLSQVAAAIRDRAGQSMVVEGHTDSRGSVAGNDALSLARAQAVLAYLVSNGVPNGQIRAQGIGSNRPVSDNRTAEGRANNRRVEVVISPVTLASR